MVRFDKHPVLKLMELITVFIFQKWVSYGYHPTDEREDVAAMHLMAFAGMTICIVLGTFAYMYSPDKT